MDVLIIIVLIIAAVILFLESVLPGSQHWDASFMRIIMHLPIWVQVPDSSLWLSQEWHASDHLSGSCGLKPWIRLP